MNQAKTNLLIKNALGVEVVHQYEKYLGLPLWVGTKRQALIILNNRFGKSSKDGKENYFHKQGGKF